MSQLKNLPKPFDARLVEKKGGHDYVAHRTGTERAPTTDGDKLSNSQALRLSGRLFRAEGRAHLAEVELEVRGKAA